MSTEGIPETLIDGRYELRRQLGRGGMGVVWEAYDNRLGRQVAVKELLFRGALDPETQAQWVERARREAQAIARIGHEHVVAVHDVIEAEGQVWIVMEQVNPHSLADQLRERGRLPALQAARIGLEVLRGLRAVHAAGVLHRDVKPHNILFRRDGRAVLMDFGIATFEGAAQVTRLHETVGTPQYLAPEVANRQPPTPASDLWSLGVTLYEMVEGRPPFRGPTPYEVLEAVRTSEPPPMAHGGPLRPLVDGLLVKDPDARMTAQRAEQLLQHVAQETPQFPLPVHADYDPQATESAVHVPEQLTDPSAAESAAPAPRPGGGRLAWRRWRALLAGGVGLVVLAAAGWFATDGLRDDNGLRLAGSPTYQAARERGYLLVGVKKDQPGLSQVSSTAKAGYEGFDIDLAWAIARHLGFQRVQFTVVDTQSREYRLKAGQVDLIVASYSITAARKEQVDFAGPYYQAAQDFLVRTDSPIHGAQDLFGHTVCTVTDSTPAERLGKQFPLIKTDQQASYGICVDELLKGQVDAVSTDDIILAGYRAQHPTRLRLLGVPFGIEEYGVGIQKNEPALKHAICDAIRDEITSGAWRASYIKHLKPLTPQQLADQRPPEEMEECA
ncbi:serine/threonine-protein kinase [Streptomyces sp. NPDC088354]|uniref:serine/threonine-protein kinase n=1 Tax=unclassified Streptomyces TaxID=2593676 RepID=UPI0029A7A652|nr:serine/threonine-protein kinase [Streptomyces sp. MI02-7b]MDX3072492.1 serine/threonine-protein kinase [Streptomyces sp. MI02-7b]